MAEQKARPRQRRSASPEPSEPEAEDGTQEAAPTGERLSEPLAEIEVDVRTIHQRMVAILAELPAIGKDSRNPEQGFMYRSHDDVLNALNPLLAKHGVYLVPEVIERVPAQRTTKRNTTMYEVNLHVRYSFIAEDGSWVAGTAWGEGTDSGDKSTNKAMTMALKNVLAQVFAVSTQEGQKLDTDGASAEETTAGAGAAAAAGAESEQEPRDIRLRRRVVELAHALDVQTQAENGRWLTLVQTAVFAAFETPFEKADEAQLEEVGKYLSAQVENGITEAPEQIDLTVPF